MSNPRRYVVIGAGGLAREVRWLIEECAREASSHTFVGFVVSDTSLLGAHDSVEEVLGDLAWLDANRDRFDALAIGIGTPAIRLMLAEQLEKTYPAECWPPLVHPNVRFDRARCTIGHGAALCAGVVATTNVVVEPFAFVNLACTLGHEAIVGRGSVLNPTANISGGVRLGPGVLVGTGAQVLQYLNVGASATIGAGAVVTTDVAENSTVVGIPARPRNQK